MTDQTAAIGMTLGLKKTALHDRHQKAGAKMVPFAGYEMPVSYPPGIIHEHRHTRSHAGLFDVSHMGQIRVEGKHSAELLETVTPADLMDLASGQLRYSLLLDEQGGIIDDLIVMRTGPESFALIVNAAGKERDFEHLQQQLGKPLHLGMESDKSMLALQGPDSASVMTGLGAELSGLGFMEYREMTLADIACRVSRSGYTGEDGFEISVHSRFANQLAGILLEDARVMLAGLGARDSLRMEAGLNLHGQEMSDATTPLETGLGWVIPRSRRSGGERPGGFLGAARILPELSRPPAKKRVGLVPKGRAPVRAGADVKDDTGQRIGHVTSGGYSPSLDHPICLARIDREHAAIDNIINAVIRGREIPATVTALPFVAHRYCRTRS